MVHRKACRYFKQVVLKMFNVKRNAVTKRNVWQGKNIAFNVLGLVAVGGYSTTVQVSTKAQ